LVDSGAEIEIEVEVDGAFLDMIVCQFSDKVYLCMDENCKRGISKKKKTLCMECELNWVV
jgi:hypothetical protein